MARIQDIKAYEILDSRGRPTIEAVVYCDNGKTGSAMVPSGASRGAHEAHELRDGDEARYEGKGVLEAVKNVTGEIRAALASRDTANQIKIDKTLIELDGTENKSRLGANAMLAVSLAAARAQAATEEIPLYKYLQQLTQKKEVFLPVPQMNLINGGQHASNGLSIQEYHILPVGAVSFAEALRMGVEIYQALRQLLVDEGFQVEVADEGGFAPKLTKSEEVFTLLTSAIERAGYNPGVEAFLGIDAAASEFYDEIDQVYELDGGRITAPDLQGQYRTWRDRYPLISIEDPFAEDKWGEWQKFMETAGKYVQVVGDDLFVTNTERIRQGIVDNAANAVLVKPNQIGTLSETLEAILVAEDAGMNVVISHRSGETEDSFIADLATAVAAGQIKTGAPSRSERTAKYNRLIKIEQETGAKMGHSLQRFLEHQRSRHASTAEVQFN